VKTSIEVNWSDTAVPADHWTKPKLIDRSPPHDRVIRNAMGAERMDGALAATSALQVPLAINKYILRLLERTPAPEVPEPLDPEASWRERQAALIIFFGASAGQ
jgi:hypothetical protein